MEYHMKKIGCIFFLFISVAGIWAQEKVRLTTGEFAPLLGEELQHGGYISHLVELTFAKAGYIVEKGYFPWARSFYLAKVGEWDGSIYWLKTPEREKDFIFSQKPLGSGNFALFYLKKRGTPPKDLNALGKYRIGTTRGYTYGPEFEDLRKAGKLQIEEADSDIMNFNKLLAGRIDLFICGETIGGFLLNTAFSPQEKALIHTMPRVVTTLGAYLIMPKALPASAERMRAFDQAFAALTASGEVARLLADFQAGKYNSLPSETP